MVNPLPPKTITPSPPPQIKQVPLKKRYSFSWLGPPPSFLLVLFGPLMSLRWGCPLSGGCNKPLKFSKIQYRRFGGLRNLFCGGDLCDSGEEIEGIETGTLVRGPRELEAGGYFDTKFGHSTQPIASHLNKPAKPSQAGFLNKGWGAPSCVLTQRPDSQNPFPSLLCLFHSGKMKQQKT